MCSLDSTGDIRTESGLQGLELFCDLARSIGHQYGCDLQFKEEDSRLLHEDSGEYCFCITVFSHNLNVKL